MECLISWVNLLSKKGGMLYEKRFFNLFPKYHHLSFIIDIIDNIDIKENHLTA